MPISTIGTAGLAASTTLTTPTLASPNITTALTLTGASGTNGQFLTSAGTSAAPTWTTAAASQWTTSGANIYYTTGNVCVGGTTNINADVTVQTGGRYNIEIQADTSLPYIQAYDRTGGAFMDFALLGLNLLFYTNGTERYRIDSSGNFLIGTTSVSSINSGNGGSAFWNSGSNNIRRLQIGSSSTGSSQLAGWNTPNGEVGNITVSGVSTTYNTSSDYRLKENIAPMIGALAKVSQLKPCTFNWKWNGSDSQGFIAHELQAVVPECVTGEKDATRQEEYEVTPAVKNAQGNITTPAVMGTRTVPKYQSVDTSFLVATLAAAIQELKAINDTQATTITSQASAITALTARITALESRT